MEYTELISADSVAVNYLKRTVSLHERLRAPADDPWLHKRPLCILILRKISLKQIYNRLGG